MDLESERMDIENKKEAARRDKFTSRLLSLMKPSYLLVLSRNSKSFRFEHRERLCKVLNVLVRQHNWAQASGVVSVLMQGTKRDKSPELNRLKYSVCIEILKRIRKEEANSSRINQIYDLWISRTSSFKGGPMQARSLAYLEQILHFLTEDNSDDASHAATSLLQHREYGNNTTSYMVIGLTFFELWYSKFLKEMQWNNQDDTPSQSEMSGSRFDYPIEKSIGHDAAYSLESEDLVRCESETSVMNDKVMHHKLNSGSEDLSMDIDQKENKNKILRSIQPLQVYPPLDESEDSLPYDVGATFDSSIISFLRGLESWLLPLKLPEDHDYHVQMLNDSNYKEAVKYLRLALHTQPPNFNALHSLVQLLLIGGQVDDALNEVEEVCKYSNAALPFRIRACILESFNPNTNMLPHYYEDLLKRDPTSSPAVSKLIDIHHNGGYSSESLVQMIALHLEAAYAEPNIWREFASCFLELKLSNEDRMSMCLSNDKDKRSNSYSVRFNQIPKFFTEGKSGNEWKLRCKSWLKRYFSKKVIHSEIIKDDLQLLTYKAASAAHMYGYSFDYVVKVLTLVNNGRNGDLYAFLRTHIQDSFGLYSSFMQRTV